MSKAVVHTIVTLFSFTMSFIMSFITLNCDLLLFVIGLQVTMSFISPIPSHEQSSWNNFAKKNGIIDVKIVTITHRCRSVSLILSLKKYFYFKHLETSKITISIVTSRCLVG